MKKRILGLLFTVLTLCCLVPAAALAANSAGGSGGSASGASSSGVTAATIGSATAVADPSTIWDWEELIREDTANVGRIWTDKSVVTDEMTNNGITVKKKGDNAAFLTALTALSSTSNLSDMSITPLDIVLVLDASGSMDDRMSSSSSTTRIAALQDAANTFIDTIAKQNESISDVAKQHQVSLVKFAGTKSSSVGNSTYRDGAYTYNYSQVMKTMAVCTESTKADFKTLINAIDPAGATNASAGMELAQGQTSGRSDAKKVVIFFTDGTPTTANTWNDSVASGAVTAAKTMKDAGATVFSIGIFDGANPASAPGASGVSNENKFMHAVSSNYPSATFAQSGGSRSSYTWTFGDRAKNADGTDSSFYKSATNATELSQIFSDISQEITKHAGYPTETTEGYESKSGYITFNDQLGDYMQVTDLSTLVYDGVENECASKTTDGLVDTYHFSGTVNSGIAKGQLSDIIITVTRSNDVAAGDKVEVKIPATLIPLRHFNIDLDKNTMSVNETTPVSVFYSSGLKAEVADLLVDPDDDMTAYIAKNTDATTGKVNFYANKWSGGALGDVTSQFNPSSGNSYYYFTQDTPIYMDRACNANAAEIVDGNTYYYREYYYKLVDGAPVAWADTREFPGDQAKAFGGALATNGEGFYYFKAGTARLVYINQLHKDKTTNVTGTATDVLNPKWSSETSVAEATTVTPHLGNNGKLMVDKPATLEVSKAITADGYNAADYADAEFTFELNVPKAANYSFSAVVLDVNGRPAGDAFTLAFDANGKATHTIKPGETLQVSGLGANWDYTVTETNMPDGFAQTAPADNDGKAIPATGTLTAGQTATASFTNKYSATGTLKGEANLAGEKILTGRNWLESDLFTFKIEATGDTPNAPLPTVANVTVADTVSVNMPEGTPAGEENPVAFNFGDITYDTPGTYYYKVYESDDDSIINQGVTASQAVYRVEVTVTDNGNGTLAVAAVKAQIVDDKGVEATGELVPASTMTFTNSYKAIYDYGAHGGLQVSKTMTGRDLEEGEFAFTITGTDDASAALLADTDRSFVNDRTCKAGAPDVMTKLANVKFTQADAGKTFTFEVAEAVPADADKLPGVTYDEAKHTVKITVADNGDGTLDVTTAVDDRAGNVVAFTNKYKAADADFATADFGLTKQLTGREWKDGESFEFKLEAVTAGAPMPQSDVATATQAGAFNFGTITYDAAGEYEYQVTEASGTAGGMAYDTNVAKFKVTVTDNLEGQLVATAALVSGTKTFTNEYKTTNGFYDTATAGFEKVISGRDWADGDSFTFNLSAVTAGAPMPRKTTATVTKDDVVNGRAPFSFGTMTYETAGTYEYQVTEVAGRLAGITYDTHTATVKVTVSDDGEGHLVAAAVVANPVFTNTYGTSMSYTAAGSLSVAKTLTGRDMTDGQFTITVTPDDQASADALGIALEGRTVSMPAAADGAQATVDVLAGHDVNFSQVNAGHTYTYKVAESYTAASGYAYDTAVRSVTIAVTDDPATASLTATTTVAGGPEGTQVFTYTKEGAANGKKAVVPFYNSYFASTDVEGGTAAQVLATKSLTGRDMTVGEFTFGVHLVGSDDDVLTATNAADGSVTLGKLHYDTKSLAQLVAQGYATRDGDDWTVCYVAYEKTAGLADKGITAMTQPIAFTVTVHDNGDGTLTATANVPDKGLAFANAYATGDPAQVSVTGVKVLAHDEGLAPNDITGKFTFTIKSNDPAAPLPTSVTATNDANGNIDFGTISFTLDDLNRALGTTGDEKKDAEEEKDEGQKKDEGEKKSEDQDETEEPAVDEPAVDVMSLDEEKTVVESEAGEEPAVEALVVNEPQVNEPVAEEPAVEEPVVEAPVAEEPVVNEPQVEEPVVEPEPEALVLLSTPVVSDAPVTSDAPEANGEATTEGALETQPAKFFRTLSLFKPATFSVAKRASVIKLAADVDPSAGNDEATPATRSYTFVYIVSESGSVAGVTNDTQVKTVRIKVTDDGLGNLTAELVGEAGEPAFTFTNSYDAVPVTSSVTDQIDVTKLMTGRDLTGGDFTFELLEGNEVVALGSNSLDGTVSMAPITYTEPGTHHYTLREVGGGLTEGGVTYDGTTYQVETVIADNGEGALVATHKVVGDQDVVFTNSYAAKPTSVVIGASKFLKGDELKDGQFTFKLVGEGAELTATNAADGTVVFDALDFDAPGTYEYDVYEVNDGQANVTYDEAKRHVTVSVTDDGEGHLVAEVAGDDAKSLSFTNTYEEPVVPTPDPEPTPEPEPKTETTVTVKKTTRKSYTPYTGDQVTWTAAALLGACALIFVAVALALKRSRK